MKNRLIIFLPKGLLFGLFLSLANCNDHVELVDLSSCSPVTKPTTFYSIDIYPIVDKTCAIPQCHVNDFEYGNFRVFDEFKKRADNGKLMFMIESRTMPHGFTDGPSFLTRCEIETMKKWIEQGALNN